MSDGITDLSERARMPAGRLSSPIRIFTCEQLGVELQSLQRMMEALRPRLGVDAPLLAQQRIRLLHETFPDANFAISPRIRDLLGHVQLDNEEVMDWLLALPAGTGRSIAGLKPIRYRCVSNYLLSRGGDWQPERRQAIPFTQFLARKSGDEPDPRLSPREFQELPSEHFDICLERLLVSISKLVRSAKPEISGMCITVHHTFLIVEPNQVVTNSPEGIHQDGMDYIVSALVIERSNIEGGVSTIYGHDARSPLVCCELAEGQGIFQPDLGSPLWHEVSPISALDPSRAAYRSSIGFDVGVIP